MGHARKLELPTDDELESEFRDALDLLIAYFAARRGLDEQVVSDIPESGSYDDDPDDMDDDDETALSRTIELKPGDLNETKSLEELAELATGSYKTGRRHYGAA